MSKSLNALMFLFSQGTGTNEKMSNLEVKLEKQDSRTEKKEALFRRMPSLRDLASECSSADVQDVILPSAIGRGISYPIVLQTINERKMKGGRKQRRVVIKK